MRARGGVAEWSIAPVLKTGNGKPFVSSNLTASAKFPVKKRSFPERFLFGWCARPLCVPCETPSPSESASFRPEINLPPVKLSFSD